MIELFLHRQLHREIDLALGVDQKVKIERVGIIEFEDFKNSMYPFIEYSKKNKITFSFFEDYFIELEDIKNMHELCEEILKSVHKNHKYKIAFYRNIQSMFMQAINENCALFVTCD